MTEFGITVPCAENEGNETLFEVCGDGLIITTLSVEMGCELVTCIEAAAAEQLLKKLIDSLQGVRHG